jgi:hypothetical protein
MSLSYADLERLLSISPPWSGLEHFRFDLQVWSLHEALASLVTCWDKVSTFEGLATTREPDAKTQELVGAWDPQFTVFAIAFPRSILHRLPPTAFPTTGTDVVVIDGNHRLHALAIRRKNGCNDVRPVGVFLGS